MPPVILVVDDQDGPFRSYIEDLFGREGEYMVVHATSWPDGYARALKHAADLRLVFISQLLEGDRRGTDLVRAIRNRQPVMPIVLMTADDNDAVTDEARKSGATTYFAKGAVGGSNTAIERTFVYWAQGGAFSTGHLDRAKEFIQSLAHLSRRRLFNFRLQNGTDSYPNSKLRDVNMSEIDKLHDEFYRIDELYAKLADRLEVTTFDLHTVVKEEINALEPRNRTFKYEGGSVSVTADRKLVGLAVREILDNAEKYSRKVFVGRRQTSLAPIKVSIARVVQTGTEFCTVVVRDYGLGVKPEDVGTIHSAFVRGQNVDARDTPGFGIGLDIVRLVLETMQVGDARGYCDVYAAHDGGGGTIAKLFLPIASVQA